VTIADLFSQELFYLNNKMMSMWDKILCYPKGPLRGNSKWILSGRPSPTWNVLGILV